MVVVISFKRLQVIFFHSYGSCRGLQGLVRANGHTRGQVGGGGDELRNRPGHFWLQSRWLECAKASRQKVA